MSNKRRGVRRADRKMPSLDLLIKRLQSTYTRAIEGDYPSQSRIAVAAKALDPCISLPDNVMAQISNKGYPIKVERGLKLYRMMSRLEVLCEPLGDTVGPSCRVRLIDFENLTWGQLFDIKGQAFNLCMRAARRLEEGKEIDGLGLLSAEERKLYQKIKPYFGGRKRPTLKSVARDLIGGRDAKISDKTALNRLAAVKDFGQRHSEDLGFSWYFINGVDSFGSEKMTGRELAIEAQLLITQSLQGAAKFREQMAQVAKIGQRMLAARDELLNSMMFIRNLPKHSGALQRALESTVTLVISALKNVRTLPVAPLQVNSE